MKPSLMEIRRHELLEEIESLVIALCKNYNLGQDICEQIGANVANCLFMRRICRAGHCVS
nr:hypothetical protein [Aggregatibacter actinomycetemcomitans]